MTAIEYEPELIRLGRLWMEQEAKRLGVTSRDIESAFARGFVPEDIEQMEGAADFAKPPLAFRD